LEANLGSAIIIIKCDRWHRTLHYVD